MEAVLERLFRNGPFIRCDGVRDRCQAFRKTICRNRGGCTLSIFATYTPSQAHLSSENRPKPSKPCISPLKCSRRPHWLPRGTIKCQGTTGAVEGVHDLLTLAMYHSMKSIRQFRKPTAPSRVWGSKCGRGAQASEQDFDQNIDQNQWDIAWN